MKKITLMKNLAAAAVFALAVSATVSCDPEDKKKDDNTDDTKYTIELVHQTHESVYIPAEDSDERTIELNTNLKIDQLKVTEKDGKDWCEAKLIEEEGTIKVLLSPIDDLFDQDLTATFTVEAVGVNDVTPLTFTVTRPKYVYLELEPDPGLQYYAKAAGESMVLTVNTNADKWYFNFKAMTAGDNWFTVSPTEGADGTQVTIIFNKNTTSDENGNIGTFNFGINRTVDENGEPLEEPYFDALAFFTVMQPLYVESGNMATRVIVSDMMGTSVYDSGVNFDFDADPMMGEYLNIVTEPADGGFQAKFFEHGTDTEISWAKLNDMGMIYVLEADTNETGKERVADMKIFGAPAEPLFTCTITQAATDAE